MISNCHHMFRKFFRISCIFHKCSASRRDIQNNFNLNSSFIVLYVQSDRETADRIPLANQRYLINNLNLATELGGQIRQVHSNRPVETIVEICREQKINIVCVGRPEFSLFSLLKNVVGMRRLIGRLSRMNIDLYILS